MDKNLKVEDEYHEQRRTTWFLWKVGVKCQILIICYLKFVDLQKALCLIEYGASNVVRKLHRKA